MTPILSRDVPHDDGVLTQFFRPLYHVLAALGHDDDAVVSVNVKRVGGAFRAETRTVGDLRHYVPPGKADVWFSPNPLREILPPGKRGEIADVARGQTLFADLDVKPGALASMDECRAVVDKLIAALGCGPAVVILSGHGMQPIWRVTEPNKITDDGVAWSALCRRWGALVQTTVAAVNPSAKADSVFNIDRILRCPGTTNWKVADEPVAVRYEVNPDAGWLDVAGLERLLPSADKIRDAHKRATDDEAQQLLDSFRGGAMDIKVTEQVNHVLRAIEVGQNRYPTMNSAVMALVNLGRAGCRGVPAALTLVEAAYAAVAQEDGDFGAFDRSLSGALQKVAGERDGRPMNFDIGNGEPDDGSAGIRDDVEVEVAKLRVRDRAKTEYAEEKARERLMVNADRAVDGLTFLTEDVDAEPLWGSGDRILWAPGEGLMICGPQGVGKSTIVQQLMLARLGLTDPEFCGLPVAVDKRPILYLAMDRPPQIRRSINRMVNTADENAAAVLKRQLVVWKGPPPVNASEAPEVFAEWVAMHGHDPGLVIVDSLKDLSAGLAKDEVGAGINAAMQLILANGTEFIDLHHQRKANADNRKPDKLSDVYGNTWLTAGMGSVVLAWGEPGAATVELTHLKQPQERVGPLIVNHAHARGVSIASDPVADLLELARAAGSQGITETQAVGSLYGVEHGDDGWVACKSRVRRRLDKLTEDGQLRYTPGAKGGRGGGGNAARWAVA